MPVSHGDYGHFTTMQVRGRAVQGYALHLLRLRDASRELFDDALDGHAVTVAILAALDLAARVDATVRVTICAPALLDALQASPRIDVSVSAALVHPRAPVRLQTVVHRRALPHLKHVGTFAQHHVRRLAVRNGWDDALLVDDRGLVLEGTFWNLGLWRGDAVVWPVAPALRGTGERLLRDALAAHGFVQSMEPVDADALRAFDGAFLVNARGVRDVAVIGDVRWSGAGDGRLARLERLLAGVAWDPLQA